MTYLDELRGIRTEAATDETGLSIQRVRKDGTGPWVWVKRRGWITPDIDLTGSADATATINAALQTAPVGGCVFLPYGRIKISGKLLVSRTRTLCSHERGAQRGPRVFSSGETQGGAQLEIPSSNTTNPQIELEQSACLRNIVAWYPSQATNATPTSYNYLIDIPTNAHGTTVENVCAINPYKLARINADGTTFSDIVSWPLAEGIVLGEVRDVTRFSRLHFVSTVDFAVGSTLGDWVRANGKAFIVNFAEEFNFDECFAHGYRVGIWFKDDGADGPGRTYGKWNGGGFDGVVDCISVNGSTCLSSTGFTMTAARLIPSVASNDGHGVIFFDTHTAAGLHERPKVKLVGVDAHGTGMDRFAWINTSSSYGILEMIGCDLKDAGTDYVRCDSSHADIYMDGVGIPTGGVRTSGNFVERIRDRNGYDLRTAGAGAVYDNGSEKIGAHLTDADATITISGGAYRIIPPGTITAARTIDIDNTGAEDDETITIDRQGTEAFALTIRDNANATIATLPSGVAIKYVARKAAGANFVTLRKTRR